MAEQAVFYDIVKTCPGGLCLDLPAHDSTAPNRKINIPHNVQKVRVPRTFALGIFIDGTLQRMYEKGYFRVEPVKQFEADVASLFFPVEDKQAIVSDKEALELLTKGNRVKIRELIQTSEVARMTFLTVAQEHMGDIASSMISDLEKMLGTELQVDEQ